MGVWRLMMSGMLYCIYVVASDIYTKTCCSTKHGEREVTSLYIHDTICVMVPSLLYVVASVELNGKHKIKTKTLNVKELNGKHKKKRGNTI